MTQLANKALPGSPAIIQIQASSHPIVPAKRFLGLAGLLYHLVALASGRQMGSLFARFLRECCKPILQRDRLYDTTALEHIDSPGLVRRAGGPQVFGWGYLGDAVSTARLGEGNTGGRR